ncbi:hypothetical protein HDU85_001364 [Gaertneriomyces sp. JEL0708]|nr:hypothetical protein HDU85_001364 [Gaertneriomyces sp. JEL0708]
MTFPVWYLKNRRRLEQGGTGRDGPIRLWWVHLLGWTLEQSGVLFIKLGQWASSRSDLLPIAICSVLSNLQNRVKPHSFNHTKALVEGLCGVSLSEAFTEFDEVPVGVGAVAQVYRARLPFDDQECAVKVLHPGVEDEIAVDLALAGLFGKLLDRLPSARYLSIPEEIDTFAKMMWNQLDLTVEANNLIGFAAHFESERNISFPRPILYNKNVLVETFHHGLLLRTFLENGPTPYDRQIAQIGVSAFLKMILRDNFFHCDLHPGNILVTFTRTPESPNPARKAGAWLSGKFDPSKNAQVQSLFSPQAVDRETLENLRRCPREAWDAILRRMLVHEEYVPHLVVLDAGLVSSLGPRNLLNLQDAFRAGIDFDGETIANLLITRCKDPSRVREPEKAKQTLKDIMEAVGMDNRGALPLSVIHTGKIIQRVTEMLRYHRIGLDGEFVSLFVCAVLAEGVGRRLFPDLDLVEPLTEYLSI